MATDTLDTLPAGYQLHWYQIDRVLGQGGFGITYLAHDDNLNQSVAIKEYLPVEFAARTTSTTVQPRTEEHVKRYEWGLERFISEARTLAMFDHPNIVRVYSVFEQNNTAYMVMRYEQGENLDKVLAASRFLEEQKLLNITLPILNGLEEVHRAGFIHRDIKPDNIYIRNDDTPVLLDFGSARQAFGDAHTLTILIAPGYAPFEQYYNSSDQQGPWTDIYSLGATLYRAVTGAAPIDAISRSRGILDSRRDILVPATMSARSRYSETLLQAVDHAMEFAERDRPQSIAEWRMELLESHPDMARASKGATSGDARGDDRRPWSEPPTKSSGAFENDQVGIRRDATTLVPTDVEHDIETSPRSSRRWIRRALVAVFVIGALGAGFVTRPYLERASSEARRAMVDVNEIRQAQQRLEGQIRELQGKLNTSDTQKRLAEQQIQRLELQKQRAEAQTQNAEGRLPLGTSQKEETSTAKAAQQPDSEVAALLKAADADLATNRLTRPPGENAAERYRAVLELDPDNPRATMGIENVVARYVDMADQATARQEFEQARHLLDRADAVLPGTRVVADARERLDIEQAARHPSIAEKPPEPSPSAASSEPNPGDRLDAAISEYRKGAYEKALTEFERLADEDGLAPASYYLGQMYARGDGVAQDDAKAAVYYQAAAELGHAQAQNSLGTMYATGRGVIRDDAKAYTWYRRAAEHGYKDAQINLGNVYADGLGVPKSNFEAYAWFTLAAKSGDALAIDRRNAVERELQRAELEHARKLARHYEKKIALEEASISEPAPTTKGTLERTVSSSEKAN